MYSFPDATCMMYLRGIYDLFLIRVLLKGIYGSICIWEMGKLCRKLQCDYVNRLIGELQGREKVQQKGVKKREKII